MSKVDNLLKRASAFEKLAFYGDRKAFLQSLSQKYPNMTQSPMSDLGVLPNLPPSQTSTDTVYTMPEVTIKGYPLIPKDVQQQLSSINVEKGWGLPLTIDGELGPSTKFALDSFKKRMNLPANMPNKQVFEKIKSFNGPANLSDVKQAPTGSELNLNISDRPSA